MSRLPQIDPKVFKYAIKYSSKKIHELINDHRTAEREKNPKYSYDLSYVLIAESYRELAEAHYCNGDPLEKVEECFDAMREYAYKFVDYRYNVKKYFCDCAYRELAEVATVYYLIDRKIDFYDPFFKKIEALLMMTVLTIYICIPC